MFYTVICLFVLLSLMGVFLSGDIVIRTTNCREDLNNVDKYPDASSNFVVTQTIQGMFSNSQCCLICLQTKCRGFFVDHGQNLCILHMYSQLNVTMAAKPGRRHFIVGSECEREGHMWSATFSLCFNFYTNTLNWTSSRDFCKNKGANLIKLDTPPEISFMVGTAQNHHPGIKFWHVGASDIDEEGTWIWEDGSSANDVMSAHAPSVDLLRNCSSLNTVANQLQQVKCNVTRRRICQWPILN